VGAKRKKKRLGEGKKISCCRFENLGKAREGRKSRDDTLITETVGQKRETHETVRKKEEGHKKLE